MKNVSVTQPTKNASVTAEDDGAAALHVFHRG
jgi:hypothetical protein